MKTKRTKKFLSLLLSTLMVISVMPFTAFAATDADLNTLKSAMTAYETKMDGTVFTNMGTAYNAYVTAQKACDAYSYGGVTATDLSSTASALTSATNAMVAFTAKTGTGTPSIGSNAIANTFYSNLVYANGSGVTEYPYDFEIVNGSVLKYGCHIRTYYPETVLLYDGVTQPSFPAIMGLIDSSKRYDIYVKYYYPTTSDFTLSDYWYGYDDGVSWPNNSDTTVGWSESSDVGSKSTVGNTGTPRSFKNTVKYTGTPSGYYTTISSLDWKGMIDNGSKTGTTNTATAVHIINYKALTDAISSAKTKFADNLDGIDKYKEGGLSSVISAFDVATTVDPNTFSYSSGVSNAVVQCATAIDGAVSGLSSATASIDGSTYSSLRTAIDQAMATYKLGNGSSTYTSATWSSFASAYETAQSAIANVVTDGYASSYNGTTITTITSNLNTAYDALETTVQLADTTQMKIAIANADIILLYKSSLTSATATALQTAYNNALGAFTNNDPTLPTTITLANQEQLDALTLALNNAIDAVVLDTTTLASDLATAKAINPVLVFDTAALTTAITNCEEALNTANNTDLTTSNIGSITTAYANVVKDIEDAIAYANTPFNQQSDAVTSTGTQGSTSFTYANGLNTVTYGYPKGVVAVKTTPTKTTFNIGNYTLYAKNTPASGSGYTQMIYEFGITNANSASTTGTMGANQFTLTGFDGEVYTKDGDETVQGGMYANSDSAASVSVGLTDAKTTTYLWFKNGEFTRTSPIACAAANLTEATAPTTTTYACNYSYIYAYGKYMSGTTAKTENYNSTSETPMDVTVVDISSLITKMGKADPFLELNAQKDYKWYTQSSYQALTDAYSAAKLIVNNNAINTYASPAAYGAAAKSAYTALVNAIAGMTVANYTATFSYKNASGVDTTKTASGTYGTALSVPTGIPASYVSGLYKYTFTGWDTEVPSTILGDITYTAQYEQSFNKADFTALDNAVTTLTNSLADKKYLASDLQNLSTFIAGLDYYNMSTEDRENVMGDSQSAIDAEKLTITSYTLSASTLDISAAQAALDTQKSQHDSDAENITDLSSINLFTNVTVNGKIVIGLNYSTQTALDNAISAALSSISVKTYSVSLNGTDVGTFAYGTRLLVSSDGTYTVTDDLSKGTSSPVCAWYYSFESVQTALTTPKYMTTSDSYGFVVKGNTYLTTEQVQGDGASSYAVTIVNAFNNKVLDVIYTSTGSFTMPKNVDYPFYTFTGYSNGVSVGQSATITSDTTITANYSVGTKDTYTINIYGVNETIDTQEFAYNDKVTITDADVDVWVRYKGSVSIPEWNDALDEWTNVDEDAFEIISYGPTLTFYACQDEEEIDGFSYADLQDFMTATQTVKINSMNFEFPQYHFYNVQNKGDASNYTTYASSNIRNGVINANTKFSIIGEFAVPTTATVVEYGVLFSKVDGKTLTLSNASTDSEIYRFKASKHTGDTATAGQYVISVNTLKATENFNYSYRSYCTYKLNGSNYTVYSDTAQTGSYTIK